MSQPLRRPSAPRWIVWLELGVLLAVLVGLGIARSSHITPAQRLEIQLEAGLLQLHALEADHFAQHGVYFDPGAPAWHAHLPWMARYPFEARHDVLHGWSVVVHADLDGDGDPGAWRVDQSEPQVRQVIDD